MSLFRSLYIYMMKMEAGICLQSNPNMDDPIFMNSTVLITEHNNEGATGFMLNKIFERNLNELVEFQRSKPYPIFNGGPVGQEHLYFIHTRPDLIEHGEKIYDRLYFGGDFKQAVNAINNRTIKSNQLKIFKGYCGWDAGELEAELAEGSWAMLKVDRVDIFVY